MRASLELLRGLLLVLLIGCEAPSPGSATETEAEAEAVVEAEAEAQAEAPGPGAGTETGPGPHQKQVDGRQLMARLQEAANIMRAMREAAITAEAAEGSECEKAFAGITAAVRSSIEGTTELGHRAPSWQVAPRDRYLAMCSDLPAPVQRCARFAYRMQNSDECTPIMEGLDDSTKAVLNRMSSRVPRQGATD